jgi:hypothetical protein
MKANELRIGNLTYRIEVKNKNNTVIDDITIYDMERIQEVHDKTFTYEPIPLTEEWLQKFGFQTEESFVYELDDITINTSRGLMCIFTKCKNNVEIEITEYVHQLQNLYFALTNKELEYNNKM